MRRTHRRVPLGVCAGVVTVVCLVLGTSTSGAQPERGAATVRISLLANNVAKPGYEVLIANFERAYPDIEVDATFASSTTTLSQLLTTQLAANNAPDVFQIYPGCGTSISVCALAKSGYLAPMVNKPWARRSIPLVTSFDKHGKGLFAFTPIVSLYGVFTNDELFKRMGLTMPATFPQLLDLCRKAKAAGKVAIELPGNNATDITSLLTGLAVPHVYAKDRKFLAKQKARKATFAGNAGWRRSLQEFTDMYAAGCFQPGAAGTSETGAITLFAQEKGLMYPGITNMKGLIEDQHPQFTVSHHLFPGGTTASETRTYLHLSLSAAVNAHASSEKQKAAQTFVDFFARPKQNALFARIQGGMTQDQFRKREVPGFMSSEIPTVKNGAYVISPVETWWNASVLVQMQNNQIGLITGQRSVDDVLKAMDGAWKLGPD